MTAGSYVGSRVRLAVATLHPGYFALVMATGMVSVGLSVVGLPGLSLAALWLTIGSYGGLLVLTGWRLAAFRTDMVADLTDPRRGFGFFTFVAGTNVLGTRLALAGQRDAATVLLVLGGTAWLLLGYLVPWTAAVGRPRRPVLADANGTWFIWVVASQSVAVLAAALEPHFLVGRRELAILAVLSWSVGVVLYAAVGVVVATRMLLYDLRPADLTPPYWVAMGATAITVLAGARIAEMADAPMVLATRGLIAGAAVVFWAFGSWLVPALVAAGWWRHVAHRVPLRYEATRWSIVFPLAMYGVAAHYLGVADRLPIVAALGRAELWVAFAAWVVTFAAMSAHLTGTVVLAPQAHSRDGTAPVGPAHRGLPWPPAAARAGGPPRPTHRVAANQAPPRPEP